MALYNEVVSSHLYLNRLLYLLNQLFFCIDGRDAVLMVLNPAKEVNVSGGAVIEKVEEDNGKVEKEGWSIPGICVVVASIAFGR